MTSGVVIAKRQQFVTALVELVEHVGTLASTASAETDRLVMDVVEAAEITHEEFQAAIAEIESRTLSKVDLQ